MRRADAFAGDPWPRVRRGAVTVRTTMACRFERPNQSGPPPAVRVQGTESARQCIDRARIIWVTLYGTTTA